MSYRYAMLIAFVISLLWIGPKAHAAPEPAEAAQGFTPTTTHIEADPWRVFKIEKPEPMAPRGITGSPAGEIRPAMVDISFCGLIDLQKYVDSQERDRSFYVGLLRLPFFRLFFINHDGKEFMPMNWYWFALMDGKVDKDYSKKNALDNNTSYARLAFFDVPLIFTGFKYKFQAPQAIYWEALDLPFSTTISHKIDKDKNEWRVLNIPMFWVWRYDRDGSSTTTNLLSSVVDVYSREQEPDEDEWRVLNAWLLGSLARGHQYNHGEQRLTLLEGVTVHDNALFFLWRRTVENDVNCTFKFHSRQVLKLPFLGPVYASWTSPQGSHHSLLPKIFRWKQAPQSIQTVF